MAASDDFKEAIKAGKLREALVIAMSHAVELDITTWVSSDPEHPEQSKPGKKMRSHINLIGGKIENEIGDQLLSSVQNLELQQYHFHHVSQSNETIDNNVKTLQKLIEILITLQQQETNLAIEPQTSAVEMLPPTINTTTESEPELDLDVDEDSIIFTLEDLEPDSQTIISKEDPQEWDDLEEESTVIDFDSSTVEEDPQEWDDLEEESTVIDFDSSTVEEDPEEWDDWSIEDPGAETVSDFPNLAEIVAEDDEDWDEIDEDDTDSLKPSTYEAKENNHKG